MPLKIPPLTPVPIQPTSAEPFSTFVSNTPSALTPLTGSELVPIIQNGASKHVPPNTIGFGPPARTILTASANYYVRTDGSDSNTGKANTAAGAWATLQHAMHFIAGNLDLSGFTVTINIGAGTFTGCGYESTSGGGNIYLLGAGVASTFIKDGPNDGVINFGECFDVNFVSPTNFFFNAFTFRPLNSGLFVFAGYSTSFSFFGVSPSFVAGTLGFDCTNSPFACIALQAESVNASIGNTFSVTGGNGSISNFLVAEGGSLINVSSLALTVTGNLAIGAFASATAGGVVAVGPGNTFTGAGVTGARFTVFSFGAITNSSGLPGGLGPNYFLGTTPGTADSSSFYDGFDGPIPNPNEQTGASYTVATADLLGRIEMNNAGANTVTVPLDSALITGGITRSEFHVTQTGAGATTVAAGAGVTVHNAGAVGGQWKTVLVYWRAANEWVQTNA